MNTELRVKLASFEGPLDLLLYLIQKDEIDIRNIKIAEITEQYGHPFIAEITGQHLERVGEYRYVILFLVIGLYFYTG